MFETYILALLIAKIKGYKLKPLIKCWQLYPIVFFELLYLFFQFNIFTGNYNYIVFAPIFKKVYLYVFMIPIIVYKLYASGFIGAILIFLGTGLNNIAIYANEGKMPVFPSLSYLTGYVDPEAFNRINDIHIIGDSSTKLIFLTDIIDIGYSILSVGDIFIRIFVLIIVYSAIKYINIDYQK